MGFLLSIFILFSEPAVVGVKLLGEHEDYEQRCVAGCVISYEPGDWRTECEAECEGYDGEAG